MSTLLQVVTQVFVHCFRLSPTTLSVALRTQEKLSQVCTGLVKYSIICILWVIFGSVYASYFKVKAIYYEIVSAGVLSLSKGVIHCSYSFIIYFILTQTYTFTHLGWFWEIDSNGKFYFSGQLAYCTLILLCTMSHKSVYIRLCVV